MAATLVFVGAFVVVTGFTGFPGPGFLRRFPTADLQDLVDRINDDPFCNGVGNITTDGEPRDPTASIDRLRSRVHLSHPWTVLLDRADATMVDGRPDEPDGPHSAPATGCAPYRTSAATP